MLSQHNCCCPQPGSCVPGIGVTHLFRDTLECNVPQSCFEYALSKRWPLYLSTKNTILKFYDGR